MENTSHLELRFEETFQKALENVFKVFGEETKQILLQFLEERYSLQRSDFLKRPDMLEEGLKVAFRTGGGKLIAQMLLKEVYRQFQMPIHERGDWNLSSHLKDIRARLETLR